MLLSLLDGGTRETDITSKLLGWQGLSSEGCLVDLRMCNDNESNSTIFGHRFEMLQAGQSLAGSVVTIASSISEHSISMVAIRHT